MTCMSFHETLDLHVSLEVINLLDVSLVKVALSYTPPPNEHHDLENISKQIEHIPINIRKLKDKSMNIRKGLESLPEKINTNKIIIKTAGKGSVIL